MYATPLNFYRIQSGRETFLEFQGEAPYRPEQQVLVLNSVLEKPLIDQRGLRVLYHAKSTDAVIAAPPENAPSLQSSQCLERPLP